MADARNSDEKRYDILQNAKGEILIMIGYREGGPENPRIVYDGSDVAVLYRSRESVVVLSEIHKDARSPIKAVNEVLVVEIENDDVAREYKVPMRIVKNIEALMQ
ncbi:MAG: hypothetical protein PHE89_06395 [Alphaproteobacteria bacterium]|nr:hypothetical protein [Alphaproteobacteria bacterium]